MTRPYSVAFKQKMVQRLTGKDAVSATQLARETGIRQQNLSRCSRRRVASRSWPRRNPLRVSGPSSRRLRVLAEASQLSGQQLAAFLEREGVKLPERARVRAVAHGSRGRWAGICCDDQANLERELSRKENALAEAAALLFFGQVRLGHIERSWGRRRTICFVTDPNLSPMSSEHEESQSSR
jgi:transposase